MAIDIGDLELCKRLVENGTNLDIEIRDCMGCKAFLYSLHKGQYAVAKYLLCQGASIAGSTCEAWPTRGFNAFHYAAVLDSSELLRLLLEKSPSEIYVGSDPIHPVHLAVLNGNAECLEVMLNHASQGM